MRRAGRVLILGANGQLGRELQRSFSDFGEMIVCGRDTVDFTVDSQLRAAVRTASPDVIVNAVAYTAVDRAESEPDLAMAINGHAPRVLAEEASRVGALLVHYSTDYVFDGSKTEAWLETDPVNPLNAYGATKLAGERAIEDVGGKHLIFRTSWVYGPHGKNFLLTMLRLGKERDQLKIVDDQVGAPTSSLELADATRAVVDNVREGRSGDADSWAGVYHMTCGGSVSWRGFADSIFERAQTLLDGRRPETIPIPSSEYPTPARRPLNSVLSNAKLNAAFAVQLPSWSDALDRVLQEIY
jgi:dTDP-4-dehydrorhamnose reductase